MKIVAIFLLSVALFSAADSAPSPDTGKTGEAPPVKDAPQWRSLFAEGFHSGEAVKPALEKKEDTTSLHPAADSKSAPQPPAVPVPQSPVTTSAAPATHQTVPTSAAATTQPAPTPAAHGTPEPPANITTSTTSKPTPAPSPAPTNTTTSTTTTSKPTPTPTPAPTNTTTSTTTTSKPAPPPAPKTTTVAPTTHAPVPVTTPAPKPAERHFDGPSFIGGAVLVLGLGAISGVLYMFYKARTDQNYRTL